MLARRPATVQPLSHPHSGGAPISSKSDPREALQHRKRHRSRSADSGWHAPALPAQTRKGDRLQGPVPRQTSIAKIDGATQSQTPTDGNQACESAEEARFRSRAEAFGSMVAIAMSELAHEELTKELEDFKAACTVLKQQLADSEQRLAYSEQRRIAAERVIAQHQRYQLAGFTVKRGA
ncbi:hypothetical protein BOTBODRAFT_171746 [Botryobasidium botryosum FD-172 SS1]|uniref:Uncharacterized protein n=1 Tax=Botryobasidium botryosum (strain FD-172 SS1) TaxID=930990 RepID=A0A067MR43_BOTB1|nr:hypothetical protein BOTBODRAFT_171746 [Botryobasidium botryosum FD-172 SS1]